MGVLGTTLSLAFVYSLLLTVALGGLMQLFSIEAGTWGAVFWVVSFFVMLWPASKLAKKLDLKD